MATGLKCDKRTNHDGSHMTEITNDRQAYATSTSQHGEGYMAFISYRHADNTAEDQQWATWLHHQLEVYDIPHALIGTRNLRGEVIPERIYPVFRDEVSLPCDPERPSYRY